MRISLKSVQNLGLCAVAALLLGGCGGFDGVQLNGKIFDAIGFNNTAPTGDPKMAVRQPLTIPPTTEALPPPGSGKVDQPSLADIQDPDKKQNVDQAELDRRQAEYCRKNYDAAQQRGDDSADSIVGPAGPCHKSIFSSVAKWTTKPVYKDDVDGSSDDGQ